MPQNWKTYNLGDVVNIKNGKPKPKEVGKIPIYGGNGILGYTNNFNSVDEIIIIGRVGAYCGSVYFENKPIWISDNAMSAQVEKGNCIKFFYFLLEQLDLNSYASGSSQPLLTQSTLNNIAITIPPLPEQKAIANILSAIDAKIENNLAINKTLEDMAMALYKEWFVDFGPFQDEKFVESELGMIPEGWVVSNLEDLFMLQRGFDLPKKKRIEGNVPIYAASGRSTYHNEYKVKAPGVTTGRSGVLGNVFFVSEDFWPLNTSLWIKEYRSSTPYHAFFVLKNIDLKEFNSGSAVPTLNRNDVHRIKVVKPEKSIIDLFSTQMAKVFKKIEMNMQQNQTLTQLRDTLLPKLISGEVRLKEFDLEEVLEN